MTMNVDIEQLLKAVEILVNGDTNNLIIICLTAICLAKIYVDVVRLKKKAS